MINSYTIYSSGKNLPSERVGYQVYIQHCFDVLGGSSQLVSG